MKRKILTYFLAAAAFGAAISGATYGLMGRSTLNNDVNYWANLVKEQKNRKIQSLDTQVNLQDANYFTYKRIYSELLNSTKIDLPDRYSFFSPSGLISDRLDMLYRRKTQNDSVLKEILRANAEYEETRGAKYFPKDLSEKVSSAMGSSKSALESRLSQKELEIIAQAIWDHKISTSLATGMPLAMASITLFGTIAFIGSSLKKRS